MSGIKRFILGIFILVALAASSFLLWMSMHHVTPILMYHIVAAEEKAPNIVSPKAFAYQMGFIKKRGFRVLNIDEYAELMSGERSISRRNVVVTFDDGHASVYTGAFPVIKEYGFPVIVYVPSDKIGTAGYLNLSQMKEMLESGLVIFGSHTKSEVYLPDLTPGQQLEEITRSKKDLENLLGVDIKHFSYPFGGFSDEIKAMVEEAGYVTAVTTNRGFDRYNEDLFELKRISMRDKDRRWDFLYAKLSGYYNLFRRAKDPY